MLRQLPLIVAWSSAVGDAMFVGLAFVEAAMSGRIVFTACGLVVPTFERSPPDEAGTWAG